MGVVGKTSSTIEDVALDGAPAGRLFLWFPVGLAARRACQHLFHSGRSFNTTWSGAVVVDAKHGYPEELIGELAELLSVHESADTRCVFKAGVDDLDVHDIARV